jgi:hypothetical protein
MIQASTDPPAPSPTADIASILGTLLNTQGRKSYKLVVQGGRLIELTTMEEKAEDRQDGLQPGWITRRMAAMRLGHSHGWLSRRWRELGLRPRKVGRVLMFREADIAALIERQRPLGRGPGRPRKVIGIIHTQS